MKVIVAGFSKTGTKSLNEALTELGYDVYDYLEHFMYHGEEWMKILKGKGEINDFRKMYKDVDAVIDGPAFLYWREIHQAFPDAKIIFTTRDEESWLRSLKSMEKPLYEMQNGPIALYSRKFLPISRRFIEYTTTILYVLGIHHEEGWIERKVVVNEMNALQIFRKHNAGVLQMAPKDKLLVFNVKEGWEPLCKFLGKEIPEKPFPHVNIGGKEMAGMKEHELTKKTFQQLIISIVVLLIVCFVICYIFSDYSMWMGFSTFFCGLLLLFFIL